DVDLDGESLQQLGGNGVHPPPVDEAEPPRFMAEADVLRRGSVWDEVDLLIDGADARPLRLVWRGKFHGSSCEDDLTGVLAVSASQHFDQRRLARAVLA